MKKINYSISFVVILISGLITLLTGCQKQVLDFRNADVVNGKMYASGANKPFSGAITNVPNAIAIAKTPTTTKLLNVALSAADDNRYVSLLGGSGSDSLCDVVVTDGYLNGDVTCKIPKSETLVFRASMNNGTLNGDFKVYDLTSNNNVFTEAKLNDGVLDGVQKTYSLRTQKLVHSLTWKNNVGEGPVEMFDRNTGNLTYHAGLASGLVDGEVVKYAPDGKTAIFKGTFVKGVVVGTDEAFSAITGKIVMHEETSGGKRNGAFKQWDEGGQLIVDQVYSDGILVKDLKQTAIPTSNVTNTDACVDSWLKAFKKETGDDSMISMEQMGEWDTWCKQGKSPAKR